jgi:hypothetical protein
MTASPSPMTPDQSAPRGAAELCTLADVGDDAKALLVEDDLPRDFIEQLVAKGLFPDAVRVIAHALPRREAVWWAWVCARKDSGAEPPPPIQAALDATERWIVQPTDENRREALLFGEAAEFGTPAGCAALAAYMSSGSLAPPELPPVPPGEFLTAKAVSGSVTLAAVVKEPERAEEKFQEFLKLGLEVADRTKMWAA